MRNAFLFFVLSVCLASGCTIGRQTEALEAQLRTQEDHLAQLASQLERTRAELAAARKDSDTLRTQLASDGQSVIPAEQAELFYRLHEIRIDPMQSSYLPGDPGHPGELQVMITPLDEFETALRIPGKVTLQILEPENSQADKKKSPAVLAEKTFAAADVRENWTAGWVTSGFVLQWPWPDELDDPASFDSVRLAARFDTLDGRSFSTGHTVRLRKSADSPSVPAPISRPDVAVSEEPEAQPTEKPTTEPPAEEIRKASFEVPPAPAARIDHSDRRTLEEFPVYR